MSNGGLFIYFFFTSMAQLQEGAGFARSLPEAVLFGHSAIAAEPWSNCSACFAALLVTFAG